MIINIDQKENALLEWTSKSFTPIDEFLLEVSEGSSSNWEKYQVVPTKDGAFHYHGKQFLTDLQPATQYKARISSKNGEGWGAPSRIAWNFATKGAGGLSRVYIYCSFL